MPETLYLIDGHALAYRMYFALSQSSYQGQRWQNSKGEPTAGVYGFATVLLRVLELEKPDYLAVAFDTGKTFRDEMFPEYKATRAKMPDDLRPQMDRIRELVDVFNIPRLEMEGFEADDVLGSVAKRLAAEGIGVKIITGDRDLLQLVGDHIIVNLPEGGKLADAKDYVTDQDVIDKFGVPPHQVVDYKALIGDKSDNIPGVKGVGEKTAQALFQQYATLDDIYSHLSEIKETVRTKLEAEKEAAYMSRALALIKTDLDVPLDLEQARPNNFDADTAEAFFKELEFKTLMNKLAIVSGKPVAEPIKKAPRAGEQISMFAQSAPTYNLNASSDLQVTIVDTTEKLTALAQDLAKAKVISFDTETTSTQEMQAEVVGISLATEAGAGWYVPVGHLSGINLPLAEVLEGLRGPLTDPTIPKIAHNAKYDYLVLARFGLRVSPIGFDTMIAEWLVDPNSRNLGLKGLSAERLGIEMTNIEELIGKGKTQLSMAEVPIEAVAAYAAADAERTLQLMSVLQDELEKVNLMGVLRDVEMPLISVLAEMEKHGVLLDLAFFEQFSKELTNRLNEIEIEIYQLAGTTFNINSTQQLSSILFERLKLTPPDRGRKTSSGHFSTAADVLEELRGEHEVIDLLLEYRELSKLRSTYVDTLPLAIDSNTGRVHTSFSQTGSVTGRLSSNNPNLQNIPTRTEIGRRVRNGFIAAPDHVLLSVDYSQIELRIVAHMAGDGAMLEAFRQGQDIHATTAAAIYNIPLEQVNKDMRRHAKAINFGLIYGMSAFGLTRTTDLTLGEAEDFVKAYFKQFPGVKKYLDETRRLAADQGYVETLLGRRRYFPALKFASNQHTKNREEREAINAPIQGTAADIMKIAMLKIPAALMAAGLKAKMLLQVHDEIVIECPHNQLEETAQLVQKTMEEAFSLGIPLSTEARWGINWGEMQVIE